MSAVRSRLPIGDRVEWSAVPQSSATSAAAPQTVSTLLDLTNWFNDEASPAAGGARKPSVQRRMYVQLLYDASASAEQAWHLEIRWNMCQGHKVEEFAKYCTRRAKQAGLLLLQVPTGRRPRPFSPPVLVPVRPPLQERAVLELRTRLNFLRESSHAQDDLHARRSSAAAGERWMHELGVAFVQRDKHGRGFLWSVNRLLPSYASRSRSEAMLARFRAACEQLELEALDADHTLAAAP